MITKQDFAAKNEECRIGKIIRQFAQLSKSEISQIKLKHATKKTKSIFQQPTTKTKTNPNCHKHKSTKKKEI